MLKKMTLLALQKAINKALSLDEDLVSKMQKLQGKTLQLIIAPLEVTFFIRFDNEIQLLEAIEGKADTVIHSSPLGLIRLSLLPASKARSLFNDKIRISGNIELGQHIKELFDEIDIDWEGHLAQFTGDVVAHQVGSLFRKAKGFTNHFRDSLRQNLTEYLQEEIRWFPCRAEIEDFFEDVDELSLDIERLQAQIQQLKTSYEIH